MATDSPTTEFRGGADGQHDRLHSLGKYEIRKRLGAGGMGTVFLAVDRELNRTIALKVLPKERAENPTLVRRFKLEAQAAAQLEHKNIVRVYEAGEINGFLYIALEYVEGIDVHELVAKRGVLPVRRSIDIVNQMARALDHAASKQIVHRDIKPANLLIKRDGTVKLADMGLARSIDEATETNITRAGMTVGTVDYMSPEQARSSQAADVRSDIYSLGCTWYHMLTGRPPFPDGGLTEKLQAHAIGKRPNPQLENDAVPESVVAVMHRMMARRPEDRYQTPRELLDDLELASKSLKTLNASVMEALAEESGSSSNRKSRSRSAAGPAALPPKDGFKPVDLTTGRTIDIDVLRFAIPTVLVIVVLGVLVWAMREGGDALSGGAGSGTPFPNAQQQEADEAGDAEKSADNVSQDDESSEPSGEQAVSGLSGARGPAGPPPVVGVPFPGAEDRQTTASGVLLIPNWVEQFRSDAVPQTRKIRVSRRAEGDGQFRRLDDALKALPRDGGVIELDGDGPFVLEPVTVASRGEIRLTAATGRNPVVYLSASRQGSAAGNLLTVRAPQLVIDNLHIVVVDPPENGLTLLNVEGGDVALRNCSITVDGATAGTVTAVAVSGRSGISGRGRSSSSSGRCLLKNVLCRGDRLTAVRLDGETGELVTGNCLLHAGGAPAIVLADSDSRGSAERSLRLLATTVISNRSAVQLVHTGDHTPAPCDVVVRRSLLACRESGGGNDPAMIVLDGWTEARSNIGRSRAAGVDWSTEESVYLNWPSLVRMIAADGAATTPVVTADEWRPFWNKALPSDAVVGLTAPPAGWDRPASITPGDVTAETWSALSNGETRLEIGCRPGDFSEIPLGMMEHVSVADRAPDVPEDFGADLPVDESPIMFDLMNRSRSLGNLLENEAFGDGTYVIASGSGPHKLEPIVIENKSIRLEFRQTGSKPLIMKAANARGGSDPSQATITLRNATLDLVGARFKMPATLSTLQPPWLFRLEDSSLSVRGCTFEGPSTPSEGHSGFIQFADVADADEREPAGSRYVAVEDSFLISPGRLLSGPIRWESMILRNSVFVSQTDVWDVQLDEAGLRRQPFAVIEHCTLAAGKSVVRFDGDVPPSDGLAPLDLVVKESVFAGAAGGEADAAVAARQSSLQTEQHVRWWGNANGYSPTLKQFVLTGEAPASPDSFAEAWTAAWGVGHEAHPLTSATDVIFAASRPGWTDLRPSHFALDPASTAAGWASDRSAIGADLKHVGAETEEDSSEDGPTADRPSRKSPRPPPSRARNRNPF